MSDEEIKDEIMWKMTSLLGHPMRWIGGHHFSESPFQSSQNSWDFLFLEK
jgi:hypothetical protein